MAQVTAPVSPKEIEAVLEARGLSPMHRLGQNFLTDRRLLSQIPEWGDVQAGDLVFEVGPGLGALSEQILARGATLLAAELDGGFCEHLLELFRDESRFHLVPGDVLHRKSQMSPEVLAALQTLSGECGYKLVANLPYQISSPLISCLLHLPQVPTMMVMMVQKEVAHVLEAEPGTDAYSPLSFLSAIYGRVERKRIVPPGSFFPRPKVDSAVVVFHPHLEGKPRPADLLPFARTLFQFRRKALLGSVQRSVKKIYGRELSKEACLRALDHAGLSRDDRIDGVEPGKILALHGFLDDR